MLGPIADPGHKAMRMVLTLTGNVPRRVLQRRERRRPEPPPPVASLVVLAHEHDCDQRGP